MDFFTLYRDQLTEIKYLLDEILPDGKVPSLSDLDNDFMAQDVCRAIANLQDWLTIASAAIAERGGQK